jgi:hypothetical protein
VSKKGKKHAHPTLFPQQQSQKPSSTGSVPHQNVKTPVPLKKASPEKEAFLEEAPSEKEASTKEKPEKRESSLPPQLARTFSTIKTGEESLLPPIPSPQIELLQQEVKEDKRCGKPSCGLEFSANYPKVLWSGKAYHKECLPFIESDDLTVNPRLDITINVRASKLARLVEILEREEDLKDLYNHLGDTLCEHNTWYARCAECGKVVMKHQAIVGGLLTKQVKAQTKIEVSITTGRFFSRVRPAEVFCSEVCDQNYAKRIWKVWEQQEKEKAELRERAKELAKARKASREGKTEELTEEDKIRAKKRDDEERAKDPVGWAVRIAFLRSKTDKNVRAVLDEMIRSMKDDSATKKARS